jgi:hypothetical protein
MTVLMDDHRIAERNCQRLCVKRGLAGAKVLILANMGNSFVSSAVGYDMPWIVGAADENLERQAMNTVFMPMFSAQCYN